MYRGVNSRRDVNRVALVAAIESLDQVASHGEFVAWTQSAFHQALPHGAFMAFVGKVLDVGVKPLSIVSANLPEAYLRTVQQFNGACTPFLMERWLQSGEPQLFDLRRDAVAFDPGCLQAFRASGLENIVAHGLFELNREHVSFFSFHQLPHPPRAEQVKALRLSVPAMHAALLRCLPGHGKPAPKVDPAPPCLTRREIEVLSWICQGKTNSEIVAILRSSPHTVKNQAQSVMVKLRVNTRGQAAVEAMRRHLITRH